MPIGLYCPRKIQTITPQEKHMKKIDLFSLDDAANSEAAAALQKLNNVAIAQALENGVAITGLANTNGYGTGTEALEAALGNAVLVASKMPDTGTNKATKAAHFQKLRTSGQAPETAATESDGMTLTQRAKATVAARS